MLSDTERAEIEKIAARYPTPQSATIDGLLALQARRGWVSDEAIVDLASALGMTAAEVDAVATFYNRIYRKPTGEHVISVCDSVSCYLMGGEGLLDRLEAKLGIKRGQTTADKAFTLIPTVCLGRCERAPAMMVGGRVFGELDDEKLDRVIAEVRDKR